MHFASAVLEPVDVSYTDEKLPAILNDSLILLPLNNPEEAYYVAGVLNSSIVLMLIASYTYELRQETHITQYIKIPKYNLNNQLHRELGELSKKAHGIARGIYEEEREDLRDDLATVEEEIDRKVAELYEITEEEKIEIELEPLLIKENESQEMEIKIANHLKTEIQNAVVKVMLEDKHMFKGEIAEIGCGETGALTFNSPKLKSGQYPLKVILEHENRKEEEIKTLFVRTAKVKKGKVCLMRNWRRCWRGGKAC